MNSATAVVDIADERAVLKWVRPASAAAAELIAHLGAFSRYRAAVQAAYFSMRIGTQDRTGIDRDEENGRGLRDAAFSTRRSSCRRPVRVPPVRGTRTAAAVVEGRRGRAAGAQAGPSGSSIGTGPAVSGRAPTRWAEMSASMAR
ncbi:hypothetical protein SAMN04488543_1985 [Friedmanniella luteola]|uniref:Uncharacterized protein n=1 Tax=Friedmanniella luteola TaxID=546871 RepID=A0A1H1TB38_9ACTN|nr:hypothetical protein [Friedmanniella luteola]SDS57525.1 hypothetical protein SAMN04488543_1985 [Friedmanniella luteola]